MGTNAVQTGKTDIQFRYSQDPENSMISKMYPCDTKIDESLPDDIRAYPLEECTCSFCEESCKPNTNIKFPTYMDGFNWQIVLITYGTIVILSVLIFFLKGKLNASLNDSVNEEEGA